MSRPKATRKACRPAASTGAASRRARPGRGDMSLGSVAVVVAEREGDAEQAGDVEFNKAAHGVDLVAGALDGLAVVKQGPSERSGDLGQGVAGDLVLGAHARVEARVEVGDEDGEAGGGGVEVGAVIDGPHAVEAGLKVSLAAAGVARLEQG